MKVFNVKAVTVGEVVSRLHEAGLCSPAANAEIMLTCLLGLNPIDLYTKDLFLNAPDYEILENMITRRLSGEPLQYITGKAGFYGHDIIVKKGVFIPRPETEILVDTVISILKDANHELLKTDSRKPQPEMHILDLCTGSGNIAISLTKALTHCKIISCDISAAALETVRENAEFAGVSERIKCLKADFLFIPGEYKKSFDAIVCNPPYIRYSSAQRLPSEVKREPPIALYGGVDGMDFYRQIVKDSPAFLKNDGFIALEIPDNSRPEVEHIIVNCGNFSDINFFKDLNGIYRVVVARLKKSKSR